MSVEKAPQQQILSERYDLRIINKFASKSEEKSSGEFIRDLLADLPNREKNFLPTINLLYRQCLPSSEKSFQLPSEFKSTVAKIRGMGRSHEEEDQAVVELQEEYDRIADDVRYEKSLGELKKFVKDKYKERAINMFMQSEGKDKKIQAADVTRQTAELQKESEAKIASLREEWQQIPEQSHTEEGDTLEEGFKSMLSKLRKSKKMLNDLRRIQQEQYRGEHHLHLAGINLAKGDVSYNQLIIAEKVWKHSVHPNVLAKAFEVMLDEEGGKVRAVRWDIAYASDILFVQDSRNPHFRKAVDEFRSTDYSMHIFGQVEKNMIIVEEAMRGKFNPRSDLYKNKKLHQAALIYIFGERVADEGK